MNFRENYFDFKEHNDKQNINNNNNLQEIKQVPLFQRKELQNPGIFPLLLSTDEMNNNRMGLLVRRNSLCGTK